MSPAPDFDAGKYAVFVWPAYAVTAAAFLVLIGDTLARARRWRRRAERLQDELDAAPSEKGPPKKDALKKDPAA